MFIDKDSKSKFTPVQSNVAIASAITSYARIHMIPFKIDPNTIYTDTDSIMTTKKLSEDMIGKGFGMMKDELDGGCIKEIYVLCIKQYGYWYNNKDGVRIEKSVWAGYTRNGLSFSDIESLSRGETLNKKVPTRFFKSFNTLNVRIKDIELCIKANPERELVDNTYQFIHIKDGVMESSFYKYLFGLCLRAVKKFNKLFK